MRTQADAREVPGIAARLGGLGSVFGKAMRDSRISIALVGIGIGILVFFVASLLAGEFGTAESRTQLASQASLLPPLFRGLLGTPIHVERMGGFISWRLFNLSPLVLGAWSVMALAGTLGGEAARGSLELLTVAPRSRSRIAVEKLLAHLAGMAAALLVIAAFTWAGILLFATLPDDPVSLGAVLGHLAWVGTLALSGGAVAFAVSPLLGRSGAVGVGVAFLVGSYVIDGYAEAIPFLDRLHLLSVFSWTAGHRPLAGASDWPSIGLVGMGVLATAGIGILVFSRRDIGSTLALRLPFPRTRLAVAGPGRRSFFERLPAAAWWGIGLATYVAVFASNGRDLAGTLAGIPAMQRFVNELLPGVDITTVSGVLQLVVFNLGTLMMALAGATLVAGWSTDETDRRLESVLASPLSRWRWALAAAGGLYTALLVTTLLFASGILLGAAASGADAGQAATGVLVAGLYGAALAGIGLAIGGLRWPGAAATVTAGLGLTLFILDLFGPALRLPRWLIDVALARHLGQPMAGTYGWGGIAVAVGLATIGALVGAWGIARRDIRG